MGNVEIGLAIAVLFAGGLIKGIAGIGLPFVSTPILVGLIGPAPAIALLILPIVATNIQQLVETRAEAGHQAAFALMLCVAAVVMVPFGTQALLALDTHLLGRLIGLLLLIYVAMKLWRPSFVLSPGLARWLAVPAGALSGLLQGATGLSGPVSVPFIHAAVRGRAAFVFCSSALFLCLAAAQAVSLTHVGVLDMRLALFGALATVPVIIATWIGAALARHLPVTFFERTIQILLFLMGLRLIFS